MNFDALNIAVTTDERTGSLLKQCYEYAAESHHPSTHNAAFLMNETEVVIRGINMLPPGVEEKPERFEGENKHVYLNHAERDVIYRAAKEGIATQGLTMIMPWLPCIHCANAVISAGIAVLIVHKQMIFKTSDRWKEELKQALELLREAGVQVLAYDGTVGAKAYMHKESWKA